MSKDRDKQGRRKGGGKGGRSGAPKRPRGGQSRYTRARAERICAVLAGGASLRAAAAAEGVEPITVLNWCKAHPDFAIQYARARETGYQMWADRITELCAEAHEVAMDTECGQQRISAIRLHIDTLKWQLSKMLPKVYGERQAVEVSGPEGKDLFPQHTREAVAEFAALVANVRAKVDGCTDGLECNYAEGQERE